MFGKGLSKLWVEKSRPKTMDDYVFKNKDMEDGVRQWINDGEVPNLLLHGPAGTGKTSLIKVICNELIDKNIITPDDIEEWNASEATSIDVVREQIMNSANTSPFGSFKILILEEFQQMSKQAQGSLKRVIEEASERGIARFFLTTNEVDKVDDAIKSRCQDIEIKAHDKDAFLMHGMNILIDNGITLGESDIDVLTKYSELCYPDMRKFINTLQQNTIQGKLRSMNSAKATFEEEIITHVAAGTILEARESIIQNMDQTDFVSFYKFLYRNIDMFLGQGSSLPEEILRAKLIIEVRDGLVRDNLCADREINLSACLCSVWMIATGTI